MAAMEPEELFEEETLSVDPDEDSLALDWDEDDTQSVARELGIVTSEL
jgi:hypothetical protein